MKALQGNAARGSVFSRLLNRWFAATPEKKHGGVYSELHGSSQQRSYMVMPGQPVWMDRNYAQFSMEAYVRNVIANRSINMVAWAAASVGFTLYITGQRGARREASAHPIIELLKRPNPTQANGAFLHSMYQYLLISGNAFVQSIGPKDRPPAELHLLRPDRVAVLAGKGGLPAGYRYTVNNQGIDFPVDRITGRSRILHLKTFHPLNDWYGLSPVEAAAYSIDQHNQSGAWNQSLLQNGARPSGALVVRGDKTGNSVLSEDQYHRVKQQIDEQFTGAANAGRPILLEGGLEWKEMSMSPRDMDFIEAKHASARDIALAFGVPPQLLGIPGDNTYSNLQEARLALWEQTVLPLVQATTDGLNNWLPFLFNERAELVPDTDNVSALAGRNQLIWERVEKASFLTEDEKRAAVGYGPKRRAVKPDA
jgi:HK97 family phage portal protein